MHASQVKDFTAYKLRRPKAGLLFFASPRFRNLGQDTPGGTFAERKTTEAAAVVQRYEKQVEVSFPGVVYDKEDIRKAILQFVNDDVDFVITEFLSWSEDFGWVRFLRDMPDIPIIFVYLAKDRYSFTNTEDEDEFIKFLCSGGLVGSLEGSGSIRRVGRKKVQVAVGDKKEIAKQIGIFAQAAKARKVLRHCNFGLLANYNEAMWSTYVDPYNLFTKIGPELRFISYSTLAAEIETISDQTALAYVKELVEKYEVLENVEEAKLLASARASLGMANVADKMAIDALIYNDIDHSMFNVIGLRPGFYPKWFNDNLSVVVPEADIGAGTITFLLKLLSKKHVNFIEPFYVKLHTGTFAGGHAGPNDHNDPAYSGKVKIARDVRFAKTTYKYAGAPFGWYRIPPGRKTMAHFSEVNGQYKLVATLVDSLEGEHFLSTYSHSVFRPIVPVDELFKQILNIGTTQHFAVVDGDYREELKCFANLMDFDFYDIR